MSEMTGVIKALDMAIRLTDLVSAGMIGQEEYKQAVGNINRKLQAARDEDRDLSWDEVEDSQAELDSAIAAGQRMHGE